MLLRHKFKRLLHATFAIAFFLPHSPARAEAPLRVGLLSCQVDGAVGKILGSFRQLSCTFERIGGEPIEFYQGEITRIGLDIGTTQYSDISWGVFALAGPYTPGALEGTYGGISGQISVGVGLGANGLIGGFDRSFALQPLSLEASRGFNLALGAAKLELFSTPGYPPPPIVQDNLPAEPLPEPSPESSPEPPLEEDPGGPVVIQGVTE